MFSLGHLFIVNTSYFYPNPPSRRKLPRAQHLFTCYTKLITLTRNRWSKIYSAVKFLYLLLDHIYTRGVHLKISEKHMSVTFIMGKERKLVWVKVKRLSETMSVLIYQGCKFISQAGPKVMTATY